MANSPQKFREIVFQILYSRDIGGQKDDGIVPLLMGELSVSKKTVLQANERAEQILALLPDIDSLIAGVSRSYTFNRIQSVEKNVLRLGIYELLFEQKVPPKVAISEAMRICRKFTSREAASFVNAILDILYKKSLGEEVKTQELQVAADALKESERRAHEAAEADEL